MANPIFSRSPVFAAKAVQGANAPAIPTPGQLAEHYAMPDATTVQTDRMSYEDTIVKTVVSFVILIAGAAIGWVFPILTIPAAIIGFVLALVNIFKKKPSPALVLAYAAFEGIFVGGISQLYATQIVPGSSIVPMAVFGTLGVVGVVLALFASGKVRASPKATKIFLVAIVGYAAFSLVNVVLMMTGVSNSMMGLRDVTIAGIPLGIPLGILVVLLASYSLVMDFDNVKRGVESGAPRIYGWTAAFGIMVTVVWLYLEILRLLSFFLPRN